jgi:DegV family protein with EDD domain
VVAVVVDSAANVPPETASELGIEVVPMYLKFGERVYRDGRDLSTSEFYRRLEAEPGVPVSTSTPSPGDFLEAFERSGQAEVVCVTVASSMSSSHQQALAAAGRFGGRVEVVDSRTAAMAEGFVAIEAGRAAAAGGSLPEVAARAREVAERTRLYATVDTFEYLRRSGRVTALQAYAATMLDIKPVFAFRGGEVAAVGRTRTKRRALAMMVDAVLAEAAGRPLHLAALHAATVVERWVTEVTPVIGAHTGPGLVGLAFFAD